MLRFTGKIINWDSMLRDNQGDMNKLISYLKNLEEKQRQKYYRALSEEYKDLGETE